jgi:DNA-binding MarR family transcriptional regulator
MTHIHPTVKFVIDLARIQAILNRRFDSGLGGLGLNELIILFHLNGTGNEGIRRIDLAEKIGLTASGVTRLLLPMEKIGLVKREVNKDDARSSLVMIAQGGKRKLEEGIERAELLADEIIPSGKKGEMKYVASVLSAIGEEIG